MRSTRKSFFLPVASLDPADHCSAPRLLQGTAGYCWVQGTILPVTLSPPGRHLRSSKITTKFCLLVSLSTAVLTCTVSSNCLKACEVMTTLEREEPYWPRRASSCRCSSSSSPCSCRDTKETSVCLYFQDLSFSTSIRSLLFTRRPYGLPK